MSTAVCRQCGREWPSTELVDVGAGRGCPACGGSPLCAQCGHSRRDHGGVFGGGRVWCRGRVIDFASLSQSHCTCSGFAQGGVADFGDVGDEPLPPLRIA